MHKQAAMSHPAHVLSSPAPRRSALVQALVWLGLLGLLWSLNLAQAGPLDSEPALLMTDVEVAEAQESVAEPEMGVSCRKPASPKSPAAELLLHEVDQAVLLHWQICRVLTHAAPAPGPQHILPEAGQQPLLRPPAALG